ncbi:CG18472 [Drosophila busckii]|uniref:CG18472 n=2 Tax=Drosophila busckii TaxID=30019 RepID=A0A0M4EQ80_DROBS|nr:CG18472 [Drosophila busckii]
MDQSKKLLEKYNIPLSHLDFVYVDKCENAREMEKIVAILRSGEEGYYPDLTRCAEEKLKKLKPESKLFRFEEQIRSSIVLDKKELEPIYDWNQSIKSKDSALNELKEDVEKFTADLPPMRTPGKIDVDAEEVETKKPAPPTKTIEKPEAKPNEQRIKSTDYSKWDKYDPDEEILRLELEEERNKEQAQIKTVKKGTAEVQEHMKLCEQAAEELRRQIQLKKLTQLEREQYAEKHRLRGNECFKSREYANAIEEYKRAIMYDPENAARAHNNRAIAYIKLQKYTEAIADCEACLKLEPANVKALLRLAEANYAQGRRRESNDAYRRVLEHDPDNSVALKALEQLRSQLGELAPAHATRMIIEEQQPAAQEKPKAAVKPQPKQVKQTAAKDYDLAELVKPNRVVKSKFISAAEALGGQLKGSNAPKLQQQPLMLQELDETQPELRLPQDKNVNKNKLLIKEL